MMDDQQQARSVPEDIAMASPQSTAHAVESEGSANAEAQQVSRGVRLMLEALLLGAVFAQDYFSRGSVPRPRPVKLKSPDTTRIDVPIETLVRVSKTGDSSDKIGQEFTTEPERKTGREADRELDIATPAKKRVRERQGTFLVVSAFSLSAAGACGFLFSYWMRLSTQILGASLAVFLGGFGFSLVLYSHWLMSNKEAVEHREPLSSRTEEREALLKDYCSAAHDVRRRRLLMWMGAGAAGLFAAIVLSMMRSLGVSPYSELYSTVWKRGQRLMTADGHPIMLDTLEHGSAVTVFPENRIGKEDAQTVLIRVQEHLLRLPADRATWAPSGYIAYSRVCTHAGCPVALFESGRNILLCPCHQSTFDVLRAASPTGGPAARPLPQLPLYADSDGTLRAGGGFTAPPGPGFWGMS